MMFKQMRAAFRAKIGNGRWIYVQGSINAFEDKN